MVDNEINLKIKCLRFNNGGEFTSNEFQHFCEKQKIKGQFIITMTPQQNGVIRRKNRTFEEMARTMLNDSKLGDIFWVQEMETLIQ